MGSKMLLKNLVFIELLISINWKEVRLCGNEKGETRKGVIVTEKKGKEFVGQKRRRMKAQ